MSSLRPPYCTELRSASTIFLMDFCPDIMPRYYATAHGGSFFLVGQWAENISVGNFVESQLEDIIVSSELSWE